MSERHDYYIALGNWTQVREEVNDYLNRGYVLAGSLVVLTHKDEDGDYVTYYQSLVKLVPERPC